MSRLFSWMQKNGRVAVDPLQTVDKVATAGRQTRKRRAFSELELLAVVPADRYALYLMAVNTGLRRGELMALNWGDLYLEAAQPFVSVRAATTKNHKPAILRLRNEVVTALCKIQPVNVNVAGSVFPKFPRIERFRRDLVKANVQY